MANNPRGDSAHAYSERLDRALIVAGIAHQGQLRKGTAIPYLMHPFHVALILDRHVFAEDLVVAGLLHDVIEDTHWNDAQLQDNFRNTFAELRDAPTDAVGFRVAIERWLESEFGAKALTVVRAVSENKADASGVKRPWRLRKQEQLEHLKEATPEVTALKAADTLHNLRSMVREVREDGPATLSRFSAPPDDILWNLTSTVSIVQERLGRETDLAVELREALDEFRSALGT